MEGEADNWARIGGKGGGGVETLEFILTVLSYRLPNL